MYIHKFCPKVCFFRLKCVLIKPPLHFHVIRNNWNRDFILQRIKKMKDKENLLNTRRVLGCLRSRKDSTCRPSLLRGPVDHQNSDWCKYSMLLLRSSPTVTLETLNLEDFRDVHRSLLPDQGRYPDMGFSLPTHTRSTDWTRLCVGGRVRLGKQHFSHKKCLI